MIGVQVPADSAQAVREFFELLKTRWEFVEAGREYEVVVSTSGDHQPAQARRHVVFDGKATAWDESHGVRVSPLPSGTVLEHGGRRMPLYGSAVCFPSSSNRLIHENGNGRPLIEVHRSGNTSVVRIGYDIFDEVRRLLQDGQPDEHAQLPTVELHLELLRDLITRLGLPLAEIPPVPAGHAFLSCLTHDIDHPVFRNHRCDHTLLGFLYRASIGSVVDVARGRKSIRAAGRNLAAAARAPFVQLGMSDDIWSGFDRYLQVEAGCPATYFVIPERDNPGRALNGADRSAPSKRACRYTLDELKPQLERITAAGAEVGLHGLDAWNNPEAARSERRQVAQVIGREEIGVRMHWLYFDKQAPRVLDEAGFSYDSTVGYNTTVGYRAGTTQVFRPLGNTTLLELPLHVMDTALFYPSYLNLSETAARTLVANIANDFVRFGGAMTINWHDRSIAPERLWEEFYRGVIADLRSKGAWFASAAETVAWYRKRRSATIEWHRSDRNSIRVQARGEINDSLPPLQIRVHRPHHLTGGEIMSLQTESPGFADLPFQSVIDFKLS